MADGEPPLLLTEEGPEDGHTFEIRSRSRMSSDILGGPKSDAPFFGPPMVIQVRAWNLPDALEKAKRMRLDQWTYKEPVTVGMASAGGRNSGNTKYIIDTLLAIAEEDNLTIEIMTADQVQLNHDQIAALARSLFPHYQATNQHAAESVRNVRRALTEANIQIAPEGE